MEAFKGPLASTQREKDRLRTSPAMGIYLSGHWALGVLSGPPELVPSGLRIKAPITDTSVSGVVATTETLIKDLICQIPTHDRHGVEVGIALSGHLNPSNGLVVHSSDFREQERSWFNVPLALRVSAATNLRTHLINDANALAVESRTSVAPAINNFASVLVGEFGLGCGLIVNDGLVLGTNGVSGEIGHLPVSPHPQPQACRCGGNHCLERVVTQAAIDAKIIDIEADDALDPRAAGMAKIQIFEEAGNALGYALVVLMNLLNPGAIVIHAPRNLITAPKFVSTAEETAKRLSFSDAGSSCSIYSRCLDPVSIARGAANYVASLKESKGRSSSNSS